MFKSPIILAAGGTGGHIFPAESLAAALDAKGYKVVFITDKQGRKFSTLPPSVQVMNIPIPRRKNTVTGLFKFGVGLLRAMYHVYRGFRRMRPALVIGFGGYPSFPACSIAQVMRIPTVLHEQNAVLGQVNRCLGKRASTVALSFKHTEGVLPSMRSEVVGTPVRREFYVYRELEYTPPKGDETFYILVTGGSQGASVFSRVIPEGLGRLDPAMRKRIQVTHQCPPKDVDALTAAYEAAGVTATVKDFIHNMAEEISRSHIVIARSGASTLAELSVVGRPSLLVPFPQAKDNHQWNNAQNLVEAGGAICVNQQAFSGENLSEQIQTFLEDVTKLKQMAMAAKASANIDALEHLGLIIDKYVQKGS